MIKKATSAAVTPEEVRALRDELEETQEQLAATLGVTVREVRAWEAGTLAVPRHEAQWIRYIRGLNARDRAAAEAGIEDCPWGREWWPRYELTPESGKSAVLQQWLEEEKRHEETCPQCIHVAAWEATQPAVPPLPDQQAWVGIIVAVFEWVESLPAWLRPAVCGVAFFGGVMLLRVVSTLLLDGPSFASTGEVLLPVLLGSVLGAIGGLIWAAVRGPLLPLGRARPFVSGAVVGVVAAIAMGIFFTLTNSSEMLLTAPGAWMMLPIGALVGGLLALRENKDG